MSGLRAFALAVLLTFAAVAGNARGLWWVTFVTGLMLGLLLRRARRALASGLASGALAWGVPLAWLSLSAPVGGMAIVVSGILGIRGSPWPAIALTVALGALLSVTGAWLGSALQAIGLRRAGAQTRA